MAVVFGRYTPYISMSSLHSLRMKSIAVPKLIKAKIKPGVVVGRERILPNGTKYNCFKGIPFAQPPLGNLRFKSPLPIERFNVDELDCTKHRDLPLQREPVRMKIVGSEDCLFLNIYAPQVNSTGAPMPVMVWIQGGGFHSGSGNSDFLLPLALLEEGVVVVTLNYRVGALGFMCLPEEGIWGNAGLKDQRLALQWVQENINNFSGDPDNVTLFGESAGAASVHLHLHAKHANKLFHKAIMQSGTANLEWIFQINPRYKTLRMAELLGCKSQKSREIIEFMQSPEKATPLAILANTVKVLTTEEILCGLPFPFKPVIEDESSPDSIVDQPTEKALRQHKYNMPVIMGYNSAEGIVMLTKAAHKIPEIDGDLARYVPRNLLLSPPEVEALTAKIRQFYFAGRQLDPNLMNEFVELLSDYHFSYNILKAAELHARQQPKSPFYFYRFEHVGQNNMYKRLFQMEHLEGACHGDELCYLFQTDATNGAACAADEAITRQMCRYWANFGRTGNPNITSTSTSKNEVIWHPVKPQRNENEPFVLDYLAIKTEFEMQKNPDKRRTEFWNSIYSQYKSTDFSLASLEL